MTKDDWIGSLEAGVNAIKYYGGADVGMRTMLDALVPAVEGLKQGIFIHGVDALARVTVCL